MKKFKSRTSRKKKSIKLECSSKKSKSHSVPKSKITKAMYWLFRQAMTHGLKFIVKHLIGVVLKQFILPLL